ncbi:fibronectin-binding protein A N-terminus-domain-containing protein, partial [Tribonema minus]
LQSVDFTTALLMTRELANAIVPARVENAFQIDAFNLAIGLRMVEGSEWLNISWHPQGARCHIGPAPPKGKEQQSYSFSQQLRTLLKGLTLVSVALAAPFERVVAFSFAQRLTDAPTHK